MPIKLRELIPNKLSFPHCNPPEELHRAALVGREAGDLPDEVPHELVARGDLSLGAGGLLLEGVGGRLVALVEAHHQHVSGCHAGIE